MVLCPCGSQKEYSDCCGLYLEGIKQAERPELLMRSRYTAYSKADIVYIKRTMKKKALANFNEEQAYLWAKNVKWEKLELISSYLDPQNEQLGYVEFKAHFSERGKKQILHELSRFELDEGEWFYIDGKRPIKTKIARNALCPCHSQKKYKNCHGAKT